MKMFQKVQLSVFLSLPFLTPFLKKIGLFRPIILNYPLFIKAHTIDSTNKRIDKIVVILEIQTSIPIFFLSENKADFSPENAEVASSFDSCKIIIKIKKHETINNNQSQTVIINLRNILY